jgi:hypothetical protein
MSAIIEQLDMTDLVPPSGVNVEQLHRDLKLQLGEALDGVVYFDEGDGKHGLSVVVRRPFNPEDVRQAAARALEANRPEPETAPAPLPLEARVAALEAAVAALEAAVAALTKGAPSGKLEKR